MRRCDIVIVNYNAGNLLADCVQSVLAEGACHVFVVDNDSHDDSLAHLSASISDARVTIIRNGQNLGFAVRLQYWCSRFQRQHPVVPQPRQCACRG